MLGKTRRKKSTCVCCFYLNNNKKCKKRKPNVKSLNENRGYLLELHIGVHADLHKHGWMDIYVTKVDAHGHTRE